MLPAEIILMTSRPARSSDHLVFLKAIVRNPLQTAQLCDTDVAFFFKNVLFLSDELISCLSHWVLHILQLVACLNSEEGYITMAAGQEHNL